MRKSIAGTGLLGALLASGLGLGIGPGIGIAAADSVQVDGNYATLAACQADGPEVQIAQNNDAYSAWQCTQGDDGLYYLYLTN
ncbi:MAG: hypothetical protein ACKOB8_15655 [Mycobacterium sp.]